MTIARSAADVLSDHVELELECLDRIYLNGYVPLLQGEAARRTSSATSAATGPVLGPDGTDDAAFVADIERHARDHGIDLIRFEKGKRKDDMTQDYLRKWHVVRVFSTSARPRRGPVS